MATESFDRAPAAPAADPSAGAPQTRPRPPAPPPRVDRKKEALKVQPLSMLEEWTAALPAPPAGPIAVDGVRAYVPLRTGQLAAVTLADGAVAWTADAKIVGSPVAGEDLVFAAAGDLLEARDGATGEPRWRAPLDGPLSAPLTCDGGWLVAATDRGTITMFRAATGERAWQQSPGASLRAAAVIAGARVFLPLQDGRVVAASLETGSPLWEFKVNGHATALLAAGERVYVGGTDKYLHCLKASNGRGSWRWRTGGAVTGTPVVDAKHVYFVALDNTLRSLNQGNGHQQWQQGLTMRPQSGPVFSDRLLVVAGISGLHAFQFVDGSPAGSVPVPAEIAIASPPQFLAAAEGEARPILVVTGEGTMTRFRPTPPPLQSTPFPATPVYPLLPQPIVMEPLDLTDEG